MPGIRDGVEYIVGLARICPGQDFLCRKIARLYLLAYSGSGVNGLYFLGGDILTVNAGLGVDIPYQYPCFVMVRSVFY